MKENPMAVERLKMAREKSLKLIQMDNQLNKIAHDQRSTINESIDGNDPTQMAMRPPQDTPRVNTTPVKNGGRLSVAAKNVPSFIRESFQKNHIDVNGMANSEGGMADLSSVYGDMQETPTVNEEYRQPQQARPAQQTGGVDYEMIKMIVESTVKKYANALNKKVLNESKEQLGSIIMGKTFRIVAKNGDIYEAKLTKTGNINDRK